MKLIFVYRNGKTFTARNVVDLHVVTGGGNVTGINYVRNIDFEAYQQTGDTKTLDKDAGLLVRRCGDQRWQDANESVSIRVDKAQLSYVIVEEKLVYTDLVGLFGDVSNRNMVSVIPCLDAFTSENIRDVLKTIS